MADKLDLLSSTGLDAGTPVAGLDLLPPEPGAFSKGFGAGASGVKSSLYGAGALVAHAAGAKELEQAALDKSAAASEAAAAQNQQVENVDWSSPTSVGKQFLWLLGNAVPSMATMFAGGAAGRGFGALASRGAATATRAAALRAGTFAGAVAPDVALEAGSIYPEALKTGVENPGVRAAVGGGLAASLDFLPLLAAERYLKAAGKGGIGALAKGAAKGAPIGAALEGGQEVGQSIIERAAAGQPLTGDEASSDYLNSFAGGAVPGLIGGAAVGAHRGAAAPVHNPPLSTPGVQAPPVDTAPQEPPLPVIDTAPGALPDIRGLNLPAVEDALPPPPDNGPPPGGGTPAESYRRGAAPVAADADFQQLETYRAQHEQAQIDRAALDQEEQKPKKERRNKEELAKARNALDTQIGSLTTQIGSLTQQIRNRFASIESADVIESAPDRTTPAEPVFPESGAFKRTEIDTTPAELKVAQQKQSVGALVSAREAKLLRDAEKSKPAKGPVEPVDQPRVRERFKQETPERRAEEIEGVAPDAVAKHKKGLEFRQGTEQAATNALNKAVVEASKAPTIELAEKRIFDAAIQALSGKVAKVDAEAFARAVAKDVRSAPDFYSKGAIELPAIDPKIDARGVVLAMIHDYGERNAFDGAIMRAGQEKNEEMKQKYLQAAAILRARSQGTLKSVGGAESRGALAVTKISDLLAHVPQVALTHQVAGGSSTNLVTGKDLGGTDNYTVSVHKGREALFTEAPTEQQLREYVEKNADLLSDPANILGTWYNKRDGLHYVDVSMTVPDVQSAIRLGREHKQEAVFYLGTYDEIPVGNAEVHDLSNEYASHAGLTPAVAIDYLPVPAERMQLIAESYNWLRDNATNDTRVLLAYEALARETEQQFAFASQFLRIDPWRQQGQPYKNSREMMQDVAQNRHLWVFEGGEAHPFFTPEQNWKFRAIHDIFGHAKTGFEFGPRGELNATRAHAQMFTKEAWPALVTETLGQNAWVNFGAENAGKAPAERAYAVQKADLLPESLWKDLLAGPANSREDSIAQNSLILSDKGQRLISHLKGMLGEDKDLEIQLTQAQPGEAIGGYTRSQQNLKALISMAVNAAGDTSIADHEGFHYLEDKVLTGPEKIVIGRQFRAGAPTFNKLIERAKAYDAAHKTNITDEILSIPQEARAYGYEFWRRGELQADTALEKVFAKIREFLERVKNYVDGLGFTSATEIFDAIARGDYARQNHASRLTEAETDWASDVEPDVIPGLRTLHKGGAASQAKGRPYWVKTGADVARMRARLKKLALEGESGRQWHAKSAAAILAWARGDQGLAAKMAALIANFSPRTPVGLDLKKAFTAFVQFEAKQPLEPGAPGEHTMGARRILTGFDKDGQPAERDEAGNIRPTGIKRENFFKNLMLGIDPKHYNVSTQGATIDMWMAHAFDYANDVMGSVTKSQYNYADAEVKRLAKELGWSVEEAQAAIWVAIKARGNSTRSLMERHALNRGWYEAVEDKSAKQEPGLFGTEAVSTKRVVKADKQRAFVTEWMRISMINPISAEQLEKANYDYARAFEDIYSGKIDLSQRLDELPYQITKPAEQDGYDMPRQPELFSRAATIAAGWTRERVSRLLSIYAVSHEPTLTHGYAVQMSPDQFLGLTAHPEDEARVTAAAEKRPLDLAAIAKESQEIFLEAKLQEDGTFKTTGHEGRHRMAALRAAGVTSVPVAVNLFSRNRGALQPINTARFHPQGVAQRGATVSDMVPITYNNKEALLAMGARGEVQFSRGAIESQTDTPEFKAWFGESKVVDKNGKPLRVYHGTGTEIDTGFDGLEIPGWFSETVDLAQERYAHERHDEAGPNIVPVYISIKNPLDLTRVDDMDAGGYTAQQVYRLTGIKSSTVQFNLRSPGALHEVVNTASFMKDAQRAGYDGIKVKEDGRVTWAIFRPEQAKSAVGNRGTFSPDSPNILYSRGAVAELDAEIANGQQQRPQEYLAAAELIDRAYDKGPNNVVKAAFGGIANEVGGNLSRWFKTNILTPNFTSRFSNGFKNVFTVLNTYDRYRSILIKTMLKEKMPEWYDASTDDQQAAFKLLLDRTVRGLARDSTELSDAMQLLTPPQRQLFTSATKMIEGFLRAELEADTVTYRQLLTTPGEYEKWLADRTAQVSDMIDKGYVPLRRYGDHTVVIIKSIVGKDGRPQDLVVARQGFNRQASAEVAGQMYKEEIARSGADLRVEVGYQYKAARDTTISVQQFIDTARRNGVPLTAMERERIVKALSKADSMTRNRLLHREGTAGYSEDGMRVLSEFGVGMAGKMAYAKFAPAIDAASDGRQVGVDIIANEPVIQVSEEADATGKPVSLWDQEGPESGFHRNLADELTDYVLVPDHTGGWSRKLRGAAMMYFIGGSISGAMVNVMSVPMLVVPELSVHTNYYNAMSTTLAAWKTTWANQDVLRDITKLKDKAAYPIAEIDSVPGLRQALIQASEDGRTMDTEIHQIMGMAQGTMYSQSRAVQRSIEAWMAPFRISEQTNRITSFIAGYKVGVENKLTGRQLYSFAGALVDSTQNNYNEANRPGAARNPVYALMFMFKSFPLFMVEAAALMYKANPKSAIYMLLGLTMMTGVEGLPFAETIEDLIDTIAQKLFNSPFNSRRAMRNVIKSASEAITGYDASNLVMRGVINDVLGMSVSSRIGAGDFVPGSRLGTADADQGRVLESMLGAPYAMLKDTLENSGKLVGGVLSGDWKQSVDALRAGGPIAARNVIKGTQQLSDGYATDSQGRKLIDVTTPAALWQMTGISSAGLAKAYEYDRIDKQTNAFYKQVRMDMEHQLSQALKAGDSSKAENLLDAARAWDERYPDMPLRLSPAAIRRQMVLSGLHLNERTLKTMPRQLRGTSLSIEGTE